MRRLPLRRSPQGLLTHSGQPADAIHQSVRTRLDPDAGGALAGRLLALTIVTVTAGCIGLPDVTGRTSALRNRFGDGVCRACA